MNNSPKDNTRRSDAAYVDYLKAPIAAMVQVDELPDHLAALLRTARKIETEATLAVMRMRREGASWQDVAEAAGITKQAAWQRWQIADRVDADNPRLSPKLTDAAMRQVLDDD
jgi:hypothetical protein